MSRVVALAPVFTAVLVLAWTGDGATQPPPPQTMATGFDHRGHAVAMARAKHNALRCTSCHRAGDPGTIAGHKTCFGNCHGRRPRRARAGHPYRIDKKRLRMCTACHAPAAVAQLRKRGTKPPRVRFPLPRRRRDRIALSGPFPVGPGFSHARHRARVKAACESCHRTITHTTANRLPRPKKAACAGCHDGATAFAMTEAVCRRCHVAPGPRLQRHTTKLVRFDHAAHSRRGASGNCRSCHTLTSNGTPLPAARNHAPCSNSGCHKRDFASVRPKICGACHVAMQPWRPLHRDRGWPLETEFGARFSHKAHLGGAHPRIRSGCAGCHQVASGKHELRLPHDHSTCTSGSCHARTSAAETGARPALSECRGCHRAGLVRKRQLRRYTARWSVRSRFRHAPHRTRPGKPARPLPCRRCHAGIDNTTGLSDIPAPSKQRCISCHDGKVGFKITGHDCARCHGSDH